MKPLVTCVGEVIVDFVSSRSGVTLQQAPGFLKATGGAPANVAVGLARLGTSVAFVGKVGGDAFGHFLANSLRASGVDITGVRFDHRHRTRLAFVSLMEDGSRDFSFWEQQPADAFLRLRDIDLDKIAQSRIVHMSSFLLLRPSTRELATRLADRLRTRGALISFDPNLRLSLWASRVEARRASQGLCRRANILRLNIEEAEFISGEHDPDKAANLLLRQGPELVVVTSGEHGCLYHTRRYAGSIKGFPVRAVDTTGCGDAFMAGLLHGVAKCAQPPGDIPRHVMLEICRYANATGALTAKRRGGAAAMPTARQVAAFLRGGS